MVNNKLKQIKEGTVGDVAQIILEESFIFGVMVFDNFFDTPELKERAQGLYQSVLHSDVYKHKVKKLIVEDLLKEIEEDKNE